MAYLDLENFDLGRLIGKGGFAKVHAAKLRTSGNDVAIKLITINKVKSKRNISAKNNSLSLQTRSKNSNIKSPKSNPHPKGSPHLSDLLAIKREIEVHSSVSGVNGHSNILSIYESFRVSDDLIGLSMELCVGGDLCVMFGTPV